MDRIPVEVLAMIFGNLSIRQLDECRRICKKWQWTIDCLMSFDCLVVYQDQLPVNQTLFPSDRRVSLQYCVHLDEFIEREEFKKGIYKKFKKILLYDHHYDNFRRRNLNNYYIMFRRKVHYPLRMVSYLQQLEELHLWAIRIDQAYRLSLPNLKTFKTYYVGGYVLSLDAPKLANLFLADFHCVTLVHPETVESLQVRGPLTEDDETHIPMSRMTGLKCLLIEAFGYLVSNQIVQNGFVERIGLRLSELHLIWYGSGLSREACHTISELKRRANSIRIYLNGIEMSGLGHLLNEESQEERDRFFHTNSLESREQRDLYLSNRSTLSETLQFFRINYGLIEELNEDALDILSARRMLRVEEVVVNQPVNDEPAFGRWLSKSKTLVSIIFERPLSQEFYSTILPASCPNLEGLTILNVPANCLFDYSFLLKFRFLQRADVCSTDHGLVERLFSKLVYLMYLAFYDCNDQTGRPSLAIAYGQYWKRKTYDVYDGQKEGWCLRTSPAYEFKSLESLVEFLKQFTGF